MGLTLYYEFGLDDEAVDAARDVLEQLRGKALTLPFAEVDELKYVDEAETIELKQEVQRTSYGGPAVFLSQASCGVQNEELSRELGEDQYHVVEPECFLRFTIFPGDGCETAVIGLSRLPPTTIISEREWSTGLSRWHWHSFCKTQYASNPQFGGVDHFLKCHLGLVELFDFANELGILKRVSDDTRYWENRDVNELRRSLDEMNRIVASFAGALKDAIGDEAGGVQAPITDFPNFEHLEADGYSPRNPSTADDGNRAVPGETEILQESPESNSDSTAVGPAVLLRDVLFELEDRSEVWDTFVNRKTGEVVGVLSDAFRALEDEELEAEESYGDATPEMIELATEIDGSSRYIRLPDQFEIHEWEIMRDFALSLDNDQHQNRLLSAVHGDGAFRRFKDATSALGLRDDWYAFREAALEQVAIRWLDSNNIPWTRERNAT